MAGTRREVLSVPSHRLHPEPEQKEQTTRLTDIQLHRDRPVTHPDQSNQDHPVMNEICCLTARIQRITASTLFSTHPLGQNSLPVGLSTIPSEHSTQ